MLCFPCQLQSGQPPLAYHPGTVWVPYGSPAPAGTGSAAHGLAGLQVFVAGNAAVTSVEYGLSVVTLINLKNVVALSRFVAHTV